MGTETKTWVLDRRVDLGSLLPLIALFFGVVAWGVRQEAKATKLEADIVRLEKEVDKDRTNTREDLKEINRKLEQLLMALKR